MFTGRLQNNALGPPISHTKNAMLKKGPFRRAYCNFRHGVTSQQLFFQLKTLNLLTFVFTVAYQIISRISDRGEKMLNLQLNLVLFRQYV